jgi:hypothetical protein
MNSSQSKNQTKEKINPYEFIKLPDKKRKQYEDEDKHTGVIEYTIKTYTPLFIPNSSTDKAFKISDEVLQKNRKNINHMIFILIQCLMRMKDMMKFIISLSFREVKSVVW